MNSKDKHFLWLDSTHTRYFLIPKNQDIPTGDFIIFNFNEEEKKVASTAITSFEVTQVEAGAFLETELNQLMEKIEISKKIKNEIPNILEELLSSSNIKKYITKIVSQVLNLADKIDQSSELVEQKIYEIITSLSQDLFAEQEKELEEKRKQEYRKSAKEAVTQSLSSFVFSSFADKDWFSEISLLPKKEQK